MLIGNLGGCTCGNLRVKELIAGSLETREADFYFFFRNLWTGNTTKNIFILQSFGNECVKIERVEIRNINEKEILSVL